MLLLLFSCSVMPDLLWPHELQHARLPCPSPSPRACSNSCPLSRWCHPTILSSVIPFNLSQHQGLFWWVSSSHQVAKEECYTSPFFLEIDLLKSHHPPLDHLLTAYEKTADRVYTNLISSMFITLLIMILKLSLLNKCNFLYQYRILSSALFYQMNLNHDLDWGFIFPQGGIQVAGGL